MGTNKNSVIDILALIENAGKADEEKSLAIHVEVRAFHGRQEIFSQLLFTAGHVFNFLEMCKQIFVDAEDDDSLYRVELKFGYVNANGFHEEEQEGSRRKDWPSVSTYINYRCGELPIGLTATEEGDDLVA